MDSERKKDSGRGAEAAACAGVAAGVVSPVEVVPQPVTDPGVLDQGRLFLEALRQTRPIVAAGSREAAQAANAVRDGTALARGLKPDTCRRLVTSGKDLPSLVSGANPRGKAAEIVAASDYRDIHRGIDPGMTNPPQRIADNVHDIRLSPDHASRKDLVFQFRAKGGMLITKPNGQVKTGTGQYVARTLVEMAERPGYGKIGYVDSRFVNPDGSPRVAPDAFTEDQARRIQKAKVRLRGIRDLDARAERLRRSITCHGEDGLDPVARHQLQELRDDIARAYQLRGTAARVAGGAAVAAATAAIVTLVVQVASGDKVDVVAIGEAAKKGALFGGGGAIADASIYHLASKLGVAPEAAKALAQQGVAAGFCLIAVGTDVFTEVAAARKGEISVAGAVAGSAAKTALDLLPFVFAPLGLLGVPVLVGTQVGGRWLLAKLRDADQKIDEGLAECRAAVEEMDAHIEEMDARFEALFELSEATDALFESAMGTATSQGARLRRVR